MRAAELGCPPPGPECGWRRADRSASQTRGLLPLASFHNTLSGSVANVSL